MLCLQYFPLEVPSFKFQIIQMHLHSKDKGGGEGGTNKLNSF